MGYWKDSVEGTELLLREEERFLCVSASVYLYM